MKFLSIIAFCAASCTAIVSPRQLNARQSSIEWKACYNQQNLECATYEAPLDYANVTAGNARLALIRYKSTNAPRIGSMFTNPGGPGGSGVAFVEGLGGQISTALGGYYDIVSWDPRGVGKTSPQIKCFNSANEGQTWMTSHNSTGLEPDAGRNFTDANAQAFYAKETFIDTFIVDLYNQCLSVDGDNLKYVGTASTVRDLVALANAIDGPSSLINYWGFSYGTVIGSYLINMFPSRIGRVVLDGSVSPLAWSSQLSYLAPENFLVDADKVFDGFCQSCVDAGTRCSVAQGRTVDGLKEYILSLIDGVFRLHPLGFTYSATEVRLVLFEYMYHPLAWKELASNIQLLSVALSQFSNSLNSTRRRTPSPMPDFELRRISAPRFGHALPSNVDISKIQSIGETFLAKRQEDNSTLQFATYLAITCGDAMDSGTTSTRTVLDEVVKVSRAYPLFGPLFFDQAGYFCHRWSTRATERYSGPWNGVPANPVLVTGNTADPVTPLANSRWIADQLGEHAILVTQESYGHTSFAMPSYCTLGHISKYLLTGELPILDVTCGTNVTLFSAVDENATLASFAKAPTVSPVLETAAPTSSQPNSASRSSKYRIGLASVIWFGASVMMI